MGKCIISLNYNTKHCYIKRGKLSYHWKYNTKYWYQMGKCIIPLRIQYQTSISKEEKYHIIKKELIWIQKDVKNLKNDWKPGICVLIWKYSAIFIQWIPTSQGLGGFQYYMHPCALDKSILSIIGLMWKLHPNNFPQSFPYNIPYKQELRSKYVYKE